MKAAAFSDTRISVVIPNFNYQSFVGAAIDSALALDWPDVEVIVIDDGSTDDSRRVIARYADRIKVILQPNLGQLTACNKGYEASTGEVVVFLDSDDLLHPGFAKAVMAVWTPDVSKVQVQMRLIDGEGEFLGSYFPQYLIVPTPQDVREWCANTTAYPTPPGSGNAYARRFLERIFPLENTCGTATDSYCLAAAPFLGDVVTIPAPLVSYRIHGRNQGAMSKLDLHQFERQLTRAHQRSFYAREIARWVGIDMPASAVNRSLSTLCYRLASIKLEPLQHPLAGDTSLRILGDLAIAFFAPQGVHLRGRIAILLWAWTVCLAPARVAQKFVLWRFAPSTRPRVLRNLLTRLRVVGA